MRSRWAALVRLLGAREHGLTLALFRVAVGAVMFYSIATVVLHGLAPALWIDKAYGGMRPAHPGFWLRSWLGDATPRLMWSLIALSLASSGAMILGLGGRVTIVIALWSYRSVSTTGLSSGGYDSMIFDAAWLLALANSTATLSADARLRAGHWLTARKVPAWPRYLVIVQLLVVYFFTGIQKASASWNFTDGYSALYWFMQDTTWARWDNSWTVPLYPLTQLSTAIVWHFEVGAPLLFLVYYYRYTAERGGRLRNWFNRHDGRRYFAAVGLSMHIGILLLMDMGPFSWISMAYYVCLLTPGEAVSLLSRWFPQLRARSQPHATAETVPAPA